MRTFSRWAALFALTMGSSSGLSPAASSEQSPSLFLQPGQTPPERDERSSAQEPFFRHSTRVEWDQQVGADDPDQRVGADDPFDHPLDDQQQLPLPSFATPPTFRIDLDDPPAQRWRHIVPLYKAELQALVHFVDEQRDDEFGGTLVGGAVIWTLARIAASSSRWYLDADLKAELEGIVEGARAVGVRGLTFDKLLVLNLGYDLLARCTSAVVQPPGGGAPIHLRNMDWDAIWDLARDDHNIYVPDHDIHMNWEAGVMREDVFWPLTANVSFFRAGQPVFTAVTWIGMVCVHTGMRVATPPEREGEDGWSVSVNFRQKASSKLGQGLGLVNNLWEGLISSWPLGFLIRKTLEDPYVKNFEQALGVFESAPLMAPSYLTIAGSRRGEGVVLERGRRGVDRLQRLTDGAGAGAVGGAGVAEAHRRDVVLVSNIDANRTTFDFTPHSRDRKWAAGDALLMTALERRETAARLIDAAFFGEGAAEGDVVATAFDKVLGVAPVLNDQTVFSTVMRPGARAGFSTRVILDWETYCRRTENGAEQLDRFRTTDAFAQTSHLVMDGSRRSAAWNWTRGEA